MKFKFYKHSKINQQELEKIADLKKRYWNYTSEEHLNWIERNIKADDIHVLMFEKENLVAYLNLINTEVVINNVVQPFIGIGNVCSSEKGKGYGRRLLIEVNNFLTDYNQSGILFCKEELVNFYKKFRWILIDKSFANQVFFKNINVMVFNFGQNIIRFEYLGRNF
jgi:hypothetical protein